MTYEEILDQLTSRLDRRQKETAQQSVGNILDYLAKVSCASKGAPFHVALRTIADKTGLNLKRAKKWVDRLMEIGVLEVWERGAYQRGATVYCLARGVHISNKYSNSDRESVSNQRLLVRDDCNNEEENTSVNEDSNSDIVYDVSLTSKRSLLNGSISTMCTPRALTLDDLDDLEVDETPVVPQKRVRGSLAELDERYKNMTPEERRREDRRVRQKQKAEKGQRLVNQLWSQCRAERAREGKYQYPVHPDVYDLLTHLDAMEDERERYDFIDKYHPFDRFFAHTGFGAPLAPQYRNLFQPPKETRKRCIRCEAEGRKRTMRLKMAWRNYLGLIFYRCDRCGHVTDLWNEYSPWKKPKDQAG